MRRTVELICLGLLGVLVYLAYAALNGPDPLPQKVPTHFDISGQPNAWGPPGFLWFLPCVAAGLYLMLTVLGNIRFRRFNLPVPVTEANIRFIQDRTILMVAWIKCEVLCLLAYLEWAIVRSTREGTFQLSPLFLPVFLAAIFITVGWNLTVLIRGAKERAESPTAAQRVGDIR